MIVKYTHKFSDTNKSVDEWTDERTKGKHREYCLCWKCDRFYPGSYINCPIAQDTYDNCVKHDIVAPVFECPMFLYKGDKRTALEMNMVIA